MKKRFWLVLIFISLCPSVYANIIVFGDSLSDAASLSPTANTISRQDYIHSEALLSSTPLLQNVGNNYWVRTPGKIGAPISNLDAKTQLSPLWPNDLVAWTFDQKPLQIIYPSAQAKKLELSPRIYNVNYAYASANSMDGYLNDDNWNKAHPYPSFSNQTSCEQTGPGYLQPGRSCVPGLIKQVRQYLSDVNQHPPTKTLFILWIGGNDVINNITKIYLANKKLPGILILPQFYNAVFPVIENGVAPLVTPIQNTTKAIELLIHAGAIPKQIYVIGLPDLSIIPASRSFAKGNVMVLSVLHSLSMLYNQLLTLYVTSHLTHADWRLPKNHVIDLSPLIDAVEMDPQRLGFQDIYASCVKKKNTPYCKGDMFFNRKHPTALTHQWIAAVVYQAIHSDQI